MRSSISASFSSSYCFAVVAHAGFPFPFLPPLEDLRLGWSDLFSCPLRLPKLASDSFWAFYCTYRCGSSSNSIYFSSSPYICLILALCFSAYSLSNWTRNSSSYALYLASSLSWFFFISRFFRNWRCLARAPLGLTKETIKTENFTYTFSCLL